MLELDRVGAGLTGPMPRRDAAKSGSRPSRSMAAVFWLVCAGVVSSLRGRRKSGEKGRVPPVACPCSPGG